MAEIQEIPVFPINKRYAMLFRRRSPNEKTVTVTFPDPESAEAENLAQKNISITSTTNYKPPSAVDEALIQNPTSSCPPRAGRPLPPLPPLFRNESSQYFLNITRAPPPPSRKSELSTTIHTKAIGTQPAFQSDAFAVQMPTTREPILDTPIFRAKIPKPTGPPVTVPPSRAQVEAYQAYKEKAQQMREKNDTTGVRVPSRIDAYDYGYASREQAYAPSPEDLDMRTMMRPISEISRHHSPAGSFPISPEIPQCSWLGSSTAVGSQGGETVDGKEREKAIAIIREVKGARFAENTSENNTSAAATQNHRSKTSSGSANVATTLATSTASVRRPDDQRSETQVGATSTKEATPNSSLSTKPKITIRIRPKNGSTSTLTTAADSTTSAGSSHPSHSHKKNQKDTRWVVYTSSCSSSPNSSSSRGSRSPSPVKSSPTLAASSSPLRFAYTTAAATEPDTKTVLERKRLEREERIRVEREEREEKSRIERLEREERRRQEREQREEKMRLERLEREERREREREEMRERLQRLREQREKEREKEKAVRLQEEKEIERVREKLRAHREKEKLKEREQEKAKRRQEEKAKERARQKEREKEKEKERQREQEKEKEKEREIQKEQEKEKDKEKEKSKPTDPTAEEKRYRWPSWLKPVGPTIQFCKPLPPTPPPEPEAPKKATQNAPVSKTPTPSLSTYVSPFTPLSSSPPTPVPTPTPTNRKLHRQDRSHRSSHSKSSTPTPSKVEIGLTQLTALSVFLAKVFLIVYTLVGLYYVLDTVREAFWALGAPMRVLNCVCTCFQWMAEWVWVCGLVPLGGWIMGVWERNMAKIVGGKAVTGGAGGKGWWIC